jgi:hypothetical protein
MLPCLDGVGVKLVRISPDNPEHGARPGDMGP